MSVFLFFLILVFCRDAVQVHRSALNDFQRSEGRELVPWKADRVTILPGITLEECAKRCSESLDCRAFNYVFRPSVICKHLPWVGNKDNAKVKRNVNCDLYEMKVYIRKCIIGNGEDYRGDVSKTKNGRTCQQWWSKFPHDHRYTPSSTNGLELNYCRNPDGDSIGPWCYTTDPEHRYDSCNVPQCKDEVCITCNGEDYRGQVDRTVSGKECQRWDQQNPHQHIYQPEKYPDKSLDDNYCRNPDASPVPWCYTTDPDVERESCDIRKCCPRVWRKSGEAQNPSSLKSSVKFPVSDDLRCHAICWCWSTVFSQVGSRCNVYQEILDHFMLPSAYKLYEDADFLFQQDSALAHSAKTCSNWFSDRGIPVLDWPDNSPDPNPIENLRETPDPTIQTS